MGRWDAGGGSRKATFRDAFIAMDSGRLLLGVDVSVKVTLLVDVDGSESSSAVECLLGADR